MAGIKAIARKIDVKPEVVASVFLSMMEMLAKGERVLIPEFGVFSTHQQPPRTIKSKILPTGVMDVPAMKGIRFKASKAAKVLLNALEATGFQGKESWYDRQD